MAIVPSLSLPALLLAAFAVSLATVAIPGPITIVASRLALSRHLSAAIWFLIGTTLLDVALFGALAGGAAPMLRRVGALPLVEIVGGLALLWAGTAALRVRPTRRQTTAPTVEPKHAAGSFALGLAVSFGNPHYWIWWVTAGVAFVEAARPHGRGGLGWMLAALIAGVIAWYVPLLLALHHGRALLSPRGEAIVNRLMGAALLLLGAGLILLGSWRWSA